MHRANGIVFRLRAILLVVATAVSVAGISAVLQSREILLAHKRLTENALPLLLLSQRMERELNLLFSDFERIEDTDDVIQLQFLRDTMVVKNARLRDNIAAISEHSLLERISTPLTEALVDAEEYTLRLLDVRSAVLETETRLASQFQEMKELGFVGANLLEEMSFHTTQSIDSLLRKLPDDQSVSGVQIEQLFSNLFLTSLDQNRIGLTLEAVIENANQLRLSPSVPQIQSIQSAIAVKNRELINLLSALPESPDRRRLAQLISNAVGILKNEGGLLEQALAQAQYRQSVAESRGRQVDLVSDVSQLSSQAVALALKEVAAQTEHLNSTTRNLIWTLAVAFLIAAVIFHLANSRIVEQQINLRMQKLTASVKAISSGDLDHEINVTGYDELGEMARALVVFRKNAQELRRSNIELEKFAYVAAHDLRSPLRSIHDLGTWTLEDADNNLTAESRAYMQMLLQRIKRLNMLLSDLLDYARAGQATPEVTDVDLQALARQTLADHESFGNFSLTFTGFDGPCRSYATPLHQILTNLIMNALKHHDREGGHISVDVELTPGWLTLTLSDDGPGIPLEYQTRVFALFQTLKTRDEVEGSGIGLSIVAKLAERFGGTVLLKSDPTVQRGVTFVVRFPEFSSVAPEISTPPAAQVA